MLDPFALVTAYTAVSEPPEGVIDRDAAGGPQRRRTLAAFRQRIATAMFDRREQQSATTNNPAARPTT